ncbi:MAG: TAT-variant-translocated molybdopterin oxidoreductase [Phycisphaerales bacterium]
MSNIDQCPSTESKTSAKPLRAEDVTPRDISAATGKAFWRSVDDLVGTREFKDFVQREFPAFASELLDGSRRHFMRVMGASLAMAGVATLPGCRRPDHKILAYAKDPEHVIPGKPLYYATSMPLPGGGAEGLLAETFEGRPVKLEGNPLHSFNNGSSGVRSQASVLDLYNPDRAPNAEIQIAGEDGEALPEVKTMGTAEFGRAAKGLFEPYTATSGAGLAFLVEKSTSPSRNSLKSRITSRFPKAAWHEYEASDDDSGIEGSRIAFGAPHHEAPSLDKAKVVVSFDRDFLGVDGNVAEQRAFSRARYTPGPGGRAAGSSMSRLYVAESAMTLTGGQADHRVAMAPSKVVAMLAAVASGLEIGNVGMRGPLTQIASGAHLSATEEKWLTGVVADLKSHRGESVVLGGRTLRPARARDPRVQRSTRERRQDRPLHADAGQHDQRVGDPLAHREHRRGSGRDARDHRMQPGIRRARRSELRRQARLGQDPAHDSPRRSVRDRNRLRAPCSPLALPRGVGRHDQRRRRVLRDAAHDQAAIRHDERSRTPGARRR